MLLPLSVCCCSPKPNDSYLPLKRVILLGIDGTWGVAGGVALFFLLQALCPELGIGGQLGIASSFILAPIGVDIVTLYLISRKKRDIVLFESSSEIFRDASMAFVIREKRTEELRKKLPNSQECQQTDVVKQKYQDFFYGCNALHQDIIGPSSRFEVALNVKIQRQFSFGAITITDYNKECLRQLERLKKITDNEIEKKRVAQIEPLFGWLGATWRLEIQKDEILLPLWERGESSYDSLYQDRKSAYSELIQNASELPESIQNDYYISIMPKPEYVYDMLKLLVKSIQANLAESAADGQAWIHLSRWNDPNRDTILIEIQGHANAMSFLSKLLSITQPHLHDWSSEMQPKFSIAGTNPLFFFHQGNPSAKRKLQKLNPNIFKTVFEEKGRWFHSRYGIQDFNLPDNF